MKSSLAPGSKVVTEYYERAGLTQYLEELGFHTVGYGCTTCIGNSGPAARADLRGRGRGRPRRLLRALREPELRGADPSRGEGELPRLSPARRRLRAGGPDGPRPDDRAARAGQRRRGRVPLGHLAQRRGGQPRPSQSLGRGRDVHGAPTPTSSRATSGGARSRSPRATSTTGARTRPTSGARRTSTACRPSPARSRTSTARAAWSGSATRSRPTTSPPPARSSRTARPGST